MCVCACVLSERRQSVEGAATDQRTVQRGMNSGSFGVLASCLDCGGFLSEASPECPSSLT